MSQNNEPEERTEDADRVSADAPAEGAEDPGTESVSTTPHSQDPAEGAESEGSARQ